MLIGAFPDTEFSGESFLSEGTPDFFETGSTSFCIEGACFCMQQTI